MPREKRMIELRGNTIGMVPQDPMSNLNPVWKIGYQVKETLRANGRPSGPADVAKVLSQAGLPDAERRAKQYPHEFSGGMRQRALIAIGLSCQPRLLIADEPTSALDVTVQRQILDHLETMTSELGTSVLLITHDLGLAAERADKVVVMYRGNVVEAGPSLELLQNPQHPYTQRLVASAPSLASRRIQVAKELGVESDELLAPGEPVVVEPTMTEDVLQIQNLRKVFKLRSGLRQVDGLHRRRRRLLQRQARHHDGDRGGVGFRQVHRGPDGAEPAEAHLRQDRVRRRGHLHAEQQGDLRLPPPRAADLPGSLRFPGPDVQHLPDHRGAAADPQDRGQGQPREEGPRAAGPGGAAAVHHAAVPERALRRPAPARGHRACTGTGSGSDHLRRGGLRPGRAGPGAGAEPARRPAVAGWA